MSHGSREGPCVICKACFWLVQSRALCCILHHCHIAANWVRVCSVRPMLWLVQSLGLCCAPGRC